eukprot:14253996-Alexandrium_andersonii.AAC.1
MASLQAKLAESAKLPLPGLEFKKLGTPQHSELGARGAALRAAPLALSTEYRAAPTTLSSSRPAPNV